MLRTNSKKAIENLKKYITDNFTPENYEEYADTNTSDFNAVAKAIYNCFMSEKSYEIKRNNGARLQDIFADWAQGLPSILDTCYYYNRSAVDDLGAILEETEEEKAKYNDERKAETLLTNLIYLRISTEARK